MNINEIDGMLKTAGTAQPQARSAWQRPIVRQLPVEDSETGVNSTSDATATFS
jgi:hypothetical protein